MNGAVNFSHKLVLPQHFELRVRFVSIISECSVCVRLKFFVAMAENPWMPILQSLLGSVCVGLDHKFENEVKTSRFVHDSTIRRERLIEWMNSLPKLSLQEDISNEYREKGNVKFKEADTASIAEAVLLYTEAICAAPPKTRALALAHGNRAAALYKLGEFQVAYNDCQCALDLNHPKPHLILIRQARSARSMSDAAKFETCIEKVEKLELADKFPEINEYRTELANMNGNAASDSTNSAEISEKKQKILISEKRGRYVVADEPIQCDDVIMTEEAFAFVPFFDEDEIENYKKIRNICDNCGEEHIAAFPCNDCQGVFYCTPRCREQHIPIHSIECNGHEVGLFLQVGSLAHLALRSFLVVFDSLLETLKSQRKGDDHPLKEADQLWPRILDTARDGELMGLDHNYEGIKHATEILRYTETTFLLCSYLAQKSLFFESTRRERLAIMSSESEWQIIVTALLLRLTSQMRCKSHNIGGLVLEENFFGPTFPPGRMFLSISLRTPLLAIHPRMGLYNHSCDPNFRLKFDKAKVHIIAAKNIAKGKEILHCNGMCSSMSTPQVERKALVKELFGFTCDCEQCSNADDVSYFQYNHIICNGNGCNAAYVPNTVAGNKCPVCFKKYDELFYLRIHLDAGMLEESVGKYEYLSDLYIKMKRYLPSRSKPRFTAGILILERFVDCDIRSVVGDETITRRMLNIAIELCETVEQTKGLGDEFLSSAALLLDILALRKVNGLDRINIEFDLMKIKRAMDVLAPRMRCKFENYFDAYAN